MGGGPHGRIVPTYASEQYGSVIFENHAKNVLQATIVENLLSHAVCWICYWFLKLPHKILLILVLDAPPYCQLFVGEGLVSFATTSRLLDPIGAGIHIKFPLGSGIKRKSRNLFEGKFFSNSSLGCNFKGLVRVLAILKCVRLFQNMESKQLHTMVFFETELPDDCTLRFFKTGPPDDCTLDFVQNVWKQHPPAAEFWGGPDNSAGYRRAT